MFDWIHAWQVTQFLFYFKSRRNDLNGINKNLITSQD